MKTGRPSGRSPLLALCAACAACSPQVLVADAQHRQLPPLPKVDPLRDGIYVRSVTLPVGEGVVDEEGTPRTREQLVTYDFRPAMPPYTKESLDELLLFPKQKETADENVVEEDTGVLSTEEGRGEDVSSDGSDSGARGQAADEEDPEGIEEAPDQTAVDRGARQNETVAGEVAGAAETSEESDATSDESAEAADETPLSSEGRQEADAASSSSDDSKVEEESAETPTGSIEGTLGEGQPMPRDDGEVEGAEDSTEIGLNGEAADSQDTVPPAQEADSENTKLVEEPADKFDAGGRSAQPVEVADESDSAAEDGGQQQEADVNVEVEEQVESSAQTSSDASDPTTSEGSEKSEDVASSEDQISDSLEEPIDEDSTTDAVDTADNSLKSEGKEQEGGDATEIEAPPETTASESDTERVDGMKPKAEEDGALQPSSDESQPEDSATKVTADDATQQPEGEVPAQDEDVDRPKERITVQYDDDDTISSASTNSNKDANRQFVDGLDELDKLFESVEVPDELDVGADGSSMQDVLVGQGLKIVWKRARNFGKGIKERFEGVAGSVRRALPQLDGILSSVGGGDHDGEEEVTLDSLLDLDKLKEGGGLLLDKEKEKKKDSEAVQPKREQKKDEPSQAGKDKNKDEKDAKKKKDAKSDKKKSFPLVKSKKAQRLWKFAKRKYEQVRHIIDDILGIFEGSDDDEDDNFGLGDLKLKDIKLPDRGAAGGASKEIPKDFDAKFGSEVDESFLKSRIEAMMKERQDQEEKSGQATIRVSQ